VAVPADQILPVLRALPPRSTVLIQKPLGRTLAEARRIVALCKSKRLIAAVNFQLRFSPNVLALRDALDRGRLGTVRDVEFRVVTHTPWSLWTFLKTTPRLEVLYHSIHYLDLIRALLGEPARVWCSAMRDPSFRGYADTRSSIALEFSSGARACVHTDHAHAFAKGHKMSQLLVEGTRGAAVAKLGVNLEYPRGEPDTLELCSSRGAWKPVALRGAWFPDAFAGTMANLQRFAAGEDDRLHTAVADSVRTMALVEACYRSATRGGTKVRSK
jgi:predicted dehydrogenase